jgi:hypothetical protein
MPYSFGGYPPNGPQSLGILWDLFNQQMLEKLPDPSLSCLTRTPKGEGILKPRAILVKTGAGDLSCSGRCQKAGIFFLDPFPAAGYGRR